MLTCDKEKIESEDSSFKNEKEIVAKKRKHVESSCRARVWVWWGRVLLLHFFKNNTSKNRSLIVVSGDCGFVRSVDSWFRSLRSFFPFVRSAYLDLKQRWLYGWHFIVHISQHEFDTRFPRVENKNRGVDTKLQRACVSEGRKLFQKQDHAEQCDES